MIFSLVKCFVTLITSNGRFTKYTIRKANTPKFIFNRRIAYNSGVALRNSSFLTPLNFFNADDNFVFICNINILGKISYVNICIPVYLYMIASVFKNDVFFGCLMIFTRIRTLWNICVNMPWRSWLHWKENGRCYLVSKEIQKLLMGKNIKMSWKANCIKIF